jgi:hypothetical protein
VDYTYKAKNELLAQISKLLAVVQGAAKAKRTIPFSRGCFT